MDKNKVNPWMISTVVLALMGGGLIGCNPRQQAGAQSPVGITPEDLALANSYYFPKHDSYFNFRTNIVNASGIVEIYTIPAGQVLVLYGNNLSSNNLRINGTLLDSFWGNRTVFPGDVISISAQQGNSYEIKLVGHFGDYDPDPSLPLISDFDKQFVRHSDWAVINGSGFTAPSDRGFVVTAVEGGDFGSAAYMYLNGEQLPNLINNNGGALFLSISMDPGDTFTVTLLSNVRIEGYYVR